MQGTSFFAKTDEFLEIFQARLRQGPVHIARIEIHNLGWIDAQFGDEAVAAAMTAVTSVLTHHLGSATCVQNSASLFRVLADPSVTAEEFLEQLRLISAQVNSAGNHLFVIELAIGYVYCNPLISTDPQHWVDAANFALIESVRRRELVVFDESMKALEALRIQLIRLALLEHPPEEIHWVFQPVVELKSKAVLGFETLIRWHPSGLEPVSPEVFIPLAEDLNVVHVLDRWTADQAIAALASMPPGSRKLIGINVSSKTLCHSGDIVEFILHSLRKHDVDPKYLVVELTESSVVEDLALLRKQLTLLADIGVSIAIDDFGSGETNLFTIASLQVRYLKLDRSLFDLDNHERMLSMLKVGATLGHTIGAQVIAEGVENEFMRDAAILAGVDLGQGWLFGRPQPFDTLFPKPAAM